MATEGQYVFLPETPEPPDVSINTQYGEFGLHSQVLRKCSKWFAASMSDAWWTGGEPNDMPRYKYVLDIDEERCSILIPAHQRVDQVEVRSNSPESTQEYFINDVCETYISMFKCFYRRPIMIRSTVDAARLVSLADQYDALEPVTDSMRADFFEWDKLDIRIMEAPSIFLNLGYQMKSARIFREAFVHLVGTWYTKEENWPSDYSTVPYQVISEPLLALVRLEIGKLRRLVSDTMVKLLALSIHGEHTHRVRTLVRNEIGRCFDKYTELGTGWEGDIFRAIANSPFQPLASEFADLDKDALVSLQQQARGLVAKVKDVARVLAKNNLRLGREMQYLTCTEISDEDLPWVI